MARFVKLSRRFQVTIPKKVREELKLKPGQELHAYVLCGRVHLSIPEPISNLRGIAKGMLWKDDYRDRNDRY